MAYRPRRRTGLYLLLASLLSGLLLTGLFGSLVLANAQSTTPPAPPAAPLQVKIVSSSAQTGGSGSAAEGASIWTEELMRQAQPASMPAAPTGVRLPSGAPSGAPAGAPGWEPAIPPDGPAQDFLLGPLAGPTGRSQAAPDNSTYPNPYSYSLFPFRAVGRVFFMMNGSAYSCSAAVIGEYAIWTAGHCVYGDGDVNGWHSSWIFVPAYQDGAGPYGIWPALYMYTTDQWKNSGDTSYDYGVVIVKPQNGLTIRQKVGALGFAYNQQVNLPRRVMGYPVFPQPTFNGQKQIITDATSAFPDPYKYVSPIPIGIYSSMGAGASGGPWMLNSAITTTAGYNLLNGNNSYLYPNTFPSALYSPYFGDVAKTMYDCASQSTPTHKTCGSEADLALSQATPSTVLPGQPFTYTLVVQNWGALDANHLVLTDTLGRGTWIVTVTLPGGTCAWLNRNITCTLAQAQRWTTVTATVAVSAPLQIGPAVNLAGVHSDQSDYTPQDNTGVPLTVFVGRTTFMPVIGR